MASLLHHEGMDKLLSLLDGTAQQVTSVRAYALAGTFAPTAASVAADLAAHAMGTADDLTLANISSTNGVLDSSDDPTWTDITLSDPDIEYVAFTFTVGGVEFLLVTHDTGTLNPDGSTIVGTLTANGFLKITKTS